MIKGEKCRETFYYHDNALVSPLVALVVKDMTIQQPQHLDMWQYSYTAVSDVATSHGCMSCNIVLICVFPFVTL